jgi:hypothetical protein
MVMSSFFFGRFTTAREIGYRDICMHLEVGWTIASESEDYLHFVTAQDFGKNGIRTHICEVRNPQIPTPSTIVETL